MSYKDIKVVPDVNQRFKQIRLTTGLSQADFGGKVKRSQNQISSIETGARNVGKLIIKDLESEFNINVDWLLTGEGQMFNSQLYNIDIKDPEIKKIAELFLQLDNDKKNKIMLELQEAVNLVNSKK